MSDFMLLLESERDEKFETPLPCLDQDTYTPRQKITAHTNPKA